MFMIFLLSAVTFFIWGVQASFRELHAWLP